LLVELAMSVPPEDLKKTSPQLLQSGPLAVAAFFVNAFSTVRKSPPPPATPHGGGGGPVKKKTTHIRLITISVSHYCEKVRWALDMLDNDPESPYYYDEDAHPPALHAQFTLHASRNEASATPMIVFKDNDETGSSSSSKKEVVLYKSDVILRRFMPSLYPKEIEQQVQDMESYLGQALGSAVRCYAYHQFLNDLPNYGTSLCQVCANKDKVSTVESILFKAMLDKGIDKGMKKGIHINSETAAASETAIRSMFAELSARLEDGREYLLDDDYSKTRKSHGFTAADLTLAALAYPLIRPPEMSFWTFNNDDQLPPALVSLCQEMAQTTAGKHVLKMYLKHRPVHKKENGVNGTGGIVVMKGAKRDKYPWNWILSLMGVVGAVGFASMIMTRSRG
jgi:glutathione S-transferase